MLSKYSIVYDGEEIPVKQGELSDYAFENSLIEYLSLLFEEAISSDNPVFRSHEMIDKRMGKHRLQKLIHLKSGNPLILKQHKIRCDTDGLSKDIR